MPQPIDMQTELGRATMADRVQQAVDRASLAAAMRARQEQAEDQVLAETHVEQTPESQSDHVDTEQKRRNPFVGRRRREPSPKQGGTIRGAETAPPAGPEGHHFDVSV